MRERIEDLRFWGLLGAIAATVLALLVPRVQLERDVYDLVAFVDLTGSMMIRDMGTEQQPRSRLEAAKASLEDLVEKLPCQSRLGLGVFTERRSFLLFNPVEVCENFAPLETAIQNLEWRMAWEGDSRIARGIYSAVGITADLKADILFYTDGHEAPPLPGGGIEIPEFEGTPGEVRGLLIGVGGHEKVPIPKFDDDGHEVGTYSADDVPQEDRTGPPPPDAHLRAGYHPKWAPFGTDPPVGDEHLSNVKTEHLVAVAARIGLGTMNLVDTPDVMGAIEENARPRPVEVAVDIRPFPAALALALLVALYAVPFAASWLSRARSLTT